MEPLNEAAADEAVHEVNDLQGETIVGWQDTSDAALTIKYVSNQWIEFTRKLEACWLMNVIQ